ncbi:catalase [Schizosaccharomyces octosporus yFS286]|uniref:Catalase n=1 Tax=Schizosaccharomyces octosporus (strain yFS286) TaxID=483514 RepID=S9QVN5_SCHOY|nr:catalase [Schizosaccharomyces octosporus yFS286]EPX70420.1 catalase [Schizosaccharomyces octosporus yFS286]
MAFTKVPSSHGFRICFPKVTPSFIAKRNFSLSAKKMSQNVYRTNTGCPIFNPLASARIGKGGPVLLQDFHLIDIFQHFDRERIPERVVHAKGSGAHGVFECTKDITQYTKHTMFSKVGKKTPMLARFSTVGGERGTPDSARDPRGFALKFYTEDGIFDMVGNNTPTFFIRDPAKFPVFIHTQKRNPQTDMKDPTMFWDYLSQNEESMHQVMILFSDRGGTPYGYRFMNGFSSHTYKFVNEKGDFYYCKWHFVSDQGTKGLTDEQAKSLDGSNPDHARKDLFDAIERGDYPSWTLYVQVMTPEEAEKYRYNIFDLTKVWPHKDVPMQEVGRFTLNQNPKNFFAEIEQAAFAPSHMVPGIEISADPVLQVRTFSYPDTHRHRLGANFEQIPVNSPKCPVFNYSRDGPMNVTDNQGSMPNYPSSLQPLAKEYHEPNEKHEKWVGQVTYHMDEVTDIDFEQPRAFWERVLGKQPGQQDNFVNNVAGHLSGAVPEVRERQYKVFSRVHVDLGQRVREATEKVAKQVAESESPAIQPEPHMFQAN